MKNKWNDNSVQFPRLISEIFSTVNISDESMDGLCESMDLTESEVQEIVDRAHAEWEIIKENT